MEKNKLIIALDFGTTYSGVAYCDTSSGKLEDSIKAVQLFTQWPGMATVGTTDKVPSRIAYGEPPTKSIYWGYQIKPNTKAHVHALMKLNLDTKLKGSKQLKLLLALLSQSVSGLNLEDSDDDGDPEDAPPAYPGKSTVDVVADYLTEIRKHIWEGIAAQYSEGLFASLPKELVVTVPAVWSERAKDLTLKAVGKAKFDATQISMVTEPEAAAVYTLRGMMEGVNKVDVNIGEIFVICDAGGGTVDLISYKVTQVNPIFKLEEAAVGSGDKCGATYIEKEFLSWLEGWIGRDAFGKIKKEKLRYGSPLLNNFEILKSHFTGVEDDIEIDLPKDCGIDDDDDKNISGRTLTLTNSQMKSFFDPCVNRSLELIDGQVAAVMQKHGKMPKMVLVVGGFGRNEYLFQKIAEYCNERNMTARKPQFPWSAVVRGAVCRGLEGPQGGLIAVRLSRRHYGTYASEPFIAGIHDPQDMYTDRLTGRKYAKGQMTWLVDKGERLPESNPKIATIELAANFKMTDDRIFGAVLVGCEEDVAPRRYADSGTYNVCKVQADLSSVPIHKFMKMSNGNGEEHFVAEFKLEAKYAGGTISWKFIYDGKEYNSVNVSYND